MMLRVFNVDDRCRRHISASVNRR